LETEKQIMNKVQQTRHQQGTGDTAVDGLLAGMMAGAGMALYLVLAGLLTGVGPLAILGLFDPARAGNALTGTLAHLAVSAIYGAIFAILLKGLERIWPAWHHLSWLAGLGYGLLLLAVARWLMLPAVDAPLLQAPPRHFAIAHVVYGLVLGYWLGKK
jgi:hypothetical protein